MGALWQRLPAAGLVNHLTPGYATLVRGAQGAVSPDALRDGDGRGEPSIPLDAYIGPVWARSFGCSTGFADES